jgi:hypothetical protein
MKNSVRRSRYPARHFRHGAKGSDAEGSNGGAPGRRRVRGLALWGGACLWLLLSSVPSGPVCHGEIYRWVDPNGVTHLSDTPPDDQARQESLSIVDKKHGATMPRQGRRNNSVVYRDNIFRIVLLDETNSSLTFELSYQNIGAAFPQIFKSGARFSICGTNRGSKYTYLSCPPARIAGNSNTVTLINQMSNLSDPRMKTDMLSLRLYREALNQDKFTVLFAQEVPFEKDWSRSRW